mgnify:CR=1
PSTYSILAIKNRRNPGILPISAQPALIICQGLDNLDAAEPSRTKKKSGKLKRSNQIPAKTMVALTCSELSLSNP